MSDAAREDELERLFQAALELAPERRDAFLVQRCGSDRERLAAVRALLAEDAHGTRGVLRASAPVPGEERIGRYRLLQVLGEGGMGTVHLAEQEEPVRRLVALKTLRLGSFSTHAAARFAAECQALADMNHPGIAKIFDGGVTEGGLPYLVMECAPGLALTEHCDRYRLTLEQRLSLFADVCDAVQHAHQKGIVHRDLKPGNVLVEVREGESLPRVIDFGIARALAGQLAAGAAELPLADRLGTPVYMSPARLLGDSAGVDTRDDVYSLGVIMYELVTGQLPYSQGTRVELARVLEQGPVAPSARLATLGPELAEVARRRSTTTRSLVARVRGELDALSLCALAPDPARRYASAAALGEDLRRLLRHEVLLGIPTGPRLRAQKFLRRHWIGASFALALVLTLVLALLAQRSAWSEAERRRIAAEDAQVELQRLRAIDQGEREESDLLVRGFKEALLLAQAGEGEGEKVSVADLLQVLAGHIETLGRTRPGAEAALRSALGRCFLAIGDEDRALEQYLRANAVGGQALADDALDRFEILEGLIESTRRTGDLAGAHTYVAQAVQVARIVFAGRDPDFHAALETLLDLAAGAKVDGLAAERALAVVLATLPDAIVRGDESGVTARIVVEAGLQLARQRSPHAPQFLAALERRAHEVLAPEYVRLVTFLWSLMSARLQADVEVDADCVRAAHSLVVEAERRLPSGHWLRSEAHRLLGRALRLRGALVEAEGELLAALEGAHAEARFAPSSARRRMHLARLEFAALARSLDKGEPAQLKSFLARSLALHVSDPDSRAPWWVTLQAGLPPRVFEAADELLRTRVEPAAGWQRGLLLAHGRRFEEALRTFEAAEKGPAITHAWRALALANLGRLSEAQTEVLAVAECRREDPVVDPELDERLAELRELLGL